MKKNYKTLAIDLDWVIHNDTKWFHDWTIYWQPIDWAKEALYKLTNRWFKIVIFSARTNPRFEDKDLQHWRIIDWLSKHWFKQWFHYSEVSNNKPTAMAYIDDKAIRFINWHDTLNYFM